jgi:hypothetical protein
MQTYNIELPKVINNFFTDGELDKFNKYMDNLLNTKSFHFFNEASNTLTDGWIINHFVGRINITILPRDIPEIFINVFEKYKNEINKDAKLSFIELVRYSTKFGNPKINPHIDPSSKQDFMLNIQLKSTKNWPISQFINDEVETSVLEDNECLVMDVAKDVHWRDPIALENNEANLAGLVLHENTPLRLEGYDDALKLYKEIFDIFIIWLKPKQGSWLI